MLFALIVSALSGHDDRECDGEAHDQNADEEYRGERHG
jgi:hypothetical protein